MTHTANNELTSTPGPGFLIGEMVDVTIRGARVVDTLAAGWLALDVAPGFTPSVDTRATAVTVTRLAPPEWPPQPGDVWADRDADTWAVCGDGNGGIEMCMHNGGTRGVWQDVNEVLANWGPMRLEFRPGWTRQPDPVPAGPAEVDERAEMIAGLRELADLLEQRPDLPFRLNEILWGNDKAEGLRLWADALGVEAKALPSADAIHWNVERKLRGLPLRIYWIDRTGAGLDRDEPTVSESTAAVEAEIADREADAAGEPTLQIVIADGGNGPAGLIGIGPVPVDDPAPLADEDDDRCTASTPDAKPGHGLHFCELYGPHPDGEHVCICGHLWPNAAAVVPPPAVMSEPCDECETTGQNCRAHSIPGSPGRSIEDVPAQRDAAE